MMVKMGKMLVGFGGLTACVWCFTHVVSLVVKTVLKVFDLPHKKLLNALPKAIKKLAADKLEVEVGEGKNNVDGMEDIYEMLGAAERGEMVEKILSVQSCVDQSKCVLDKQKSF